MQNNEIERFHAGAKKDYAIGIVSSLAQLFPPAAVFFEAYNQYQGIKKEENLENFRNYVLKILKDHEKKFCELSNRINWEEICHLMLITIDRVIIESQESRREKYAKLFVNCILLWDQFSFDERRMFIQLFSELSDNDILYLSKIYKGSRDSKKTYGESQVLLSYFGYDLIPVVPYIKRLESKGLVYELIYPLVISSKNEAENDFSREWIDKGYDVTPLGEKFCHFLTD
jgi:hypothetical protein